MVKKMLFLNLAIMAVLAFLYARRQCVRSDWRSWCHDAIEIRKEILSGDYTPEKMRDDFGEPSYSFSRESFDSVSQKEVDNQSRLPVSWSDFKEAFGFSMGQNRDKWDHINVHRYSFSFGKTLSCYFILDSDDELLDFVFTITKKNRGK
jgi:hypothetical protein